MDIRLASGSWLSRRRGATTALAIVCAALVVASLAFPSTAMAASFFGGVVNWSPAKNASASGKTKLAFRRYDGEVAGLYGPTYRFTAGNRKTRFYVLAGSGSSRYVRVSRNKFVRYLRKYPCTFGWIRWSWRTVGGKRVRYVTRIRANNFAE